jgi:hypothetical protein
MLLEVAVPKSLEYNLVSLLGERYTGMSYERAMDSITNMHKSGGQGDSLCKKGMAAGRGGNEGINGLLHV